MRVEPIQENVDGFVAEVMAQYEVEQEQLMIYNEAIMDYDPLKYINYDEIQTLTNNMSENGTELSEAIIETDIQQMEYVADVYTATREDLFTLQDNIVQAKEDSDRAVEEGLQELKDTKSVNSEQNRMNLWSIPLALSIWKQTEKEKIYGQIRSGQKVTACMLRLRRKGITRIVLRT